MLLAFQVKEEQVGFVCFGESMLYFHWFLSPNIISVGMLGEGASKWHFVGIYGWAKEEEKYRTWDFIRSLCEMSTILILISGDFNEILSYDKKEGGADRVRREMVPFRYTLDDCALGDFRFTRMWYTYERGLNVATRIKECLDRFVCTSTWLHLFSSCIVEHGIRTSPIMCLLLPIYKHALTTGRKNEDFSLRLVRCWMMDSKGWLKAPGRIWLWKVFLLHCFVG